MKRPGREPRPPSTRSFVLSRFPGLTLKAQGQFCSDCIMEKQEDTEQFKPRQGE